MLLVSVLAVCGRRGRDVVMPGRRDAATPPLLLTSVLDVCSWCVLLMPVLVMVLMHAVHVCYWNISCCCSLSCVCYLYVLAA